MQIDNSRLHLAIYYLLRVPYTTVRHPLSTPRSPPVSHPVPHERAFLYPYGYLVPRSQSHRRFFRESIYSSKTIVAIAHRLSTIQTADKIFVIKNGSLKEEGNFNSLIELNGLFKKMVDDQTFIV